MVGLLRHRRAVWANATGCDTFKKSQHVNQKQFGLNGCVLADVSKAARSDATATASHVGGDDVYNNGERQSNFTKHEGAKATSLLSLPPRWKGDEVENNTNFMYKAFGRGKRLKSTSETISPWQGACQNQEISYAGLFPPLFCITVFVASGCQSHTHKQTLANMQDPNRLFLLCDSTEME